jgi:uncharacterized RmlC-like cupin family protein
MSNEIITIRPDATTMTRQRLPNFVGISATTTGATGDFIFIPANVPHQPIKLSDAEPAQATVARNDANEQESVQSYDPGAEA